MNFHDEGFNMWEIDTEYEANRQIAARIEVMQKSYSELLEIAERFGIRVDFDLKSEINRGHNRDQYVNWNPSSQDC